MELRSFSPQTKNAGPRTYSICLKLRVCKNFTIDLNGRILLRSEEPDNEDCDVIT